MIHVKIYDGDTRYYAKIGYERNWCIAAQGKNNYHFYYRRVSFLCRVKTLWTLGYFFDLHYVYGESGTVSYDFRVLILCCCFCSFRSGGPISPPITIGGA